MARINWEELNKIRKNQIIFATNNSFLLRIF
jgi:hypothetical protein